MNATTSRKVLAPFMFLAVTTLGACVVSKPPQNVGFGRATTLHDFEGAYTNLGEVKKGDPAIALSSIIWPNDKAMKHGNIPTIDVRAEGDTGLVVRAIGTDGDAVKTSTFTRGVQFDLHEGRLRLKRKSQGVAPDAEGGVFLGVGTETVELGIDARGDVKYKSTISAAGVVFLVVPIVAGGITEIRFRRLQE